MTAIDPRTALCSPALSEPVRRFLEPPRFAIAATLNADGSPIQAVIWYLLDGDEIVFNSRLGRQWPSNLQRDRRVSITVADRYDYVDLRGEVEIDDDPQRGQAVIAQLTRRYQPDEEIADAQIAGFEKQQRVTFRLRPSKVFTRLSDC
jgi:PPOX class probable F420-dependent enzyme